MRYRTSPICPQCGDNDQVRKASVVYDEGRTYIETSHRYGVEEIRSTTTRLTVLARKVAPPEAPAVLEQDWKKKPSGVRFGCLTIFCGITTLYFIYFAVNYPQAIYMPICCGIVLAFLLRRDVSKSRPKALTTSEQASIKEYQAALERWRISYYCYRCGIKFMPISADY